MFTKVVINIIPTLPPKLSRKVLCLSALFFNSLATGDFIPLGDVSASTGKKVTLANLVSYLNGNVVPSNIVVGSYMGDYEIVQAEENIRTINLGFRPKAVLVMRNDGCTYNFSTSSQISGGLAIQGGNLEYVVHNLDNDTWSTGDTAMQIVSNGFKVSTYVNSNRYSNIYMNVKGNKYYYIAIK